MDGSLASAPLAIRLDAPMSPQSAPADPKRPRRILAIDGGGIRCLIAIEVLLALEERLQRATGDAGRRLCQHFDLVAGTSGGAIVGTAIALGLSMREIRDFVVGNARHMFSLASLPARYYSWYDKTTLEQNMKDWFGPDTALGSDKLQTLLLVIMRNWSTDSPWLVSNNPHAPFNDRALDDCNLDLPLWQLARASSAAPGYYTPETIRFGRANPYDFVFVDGGLTGFLNPAFKAFQYATTGPYGLNWKASEEDLVLVSIGAGDARYRKPHKTADDLHILRAALEFPNAMLQATVREQDLLCRTFGRCETGEPIDLEVGDLRGASTALASRLFTYHRINPVLSRAGLGAIGCAHIDPRDVIPIDAVEHVAALSEVGQAIAARTLDGVLSDCV